MNTSLTSEEIVLTIPNSDMGVLRTISKRMGWTFKRKRTAKPRLYDPETGNCLNEATMKVIEDAQKGKDVIEVGSMDEYLKLVNKL